MDGNLNESICLIGEQLVNFTGDCLDFYYHMYGSQMGDLIVYTRVGTVDTPVWKLSGDKGNSWKQAQVQISSKQPYKVLY